MTSKEDKLIVSMMHKGMHFSVMTTKAERDEMSRLMDEDMSWTQKGVDLLRQARENLAKAQQSQ